MITVGKPCEAIVQVSLIDAEYPVWGGSQTFFVKTVCGDQRFKCGLDPLPLQLGLKEPACKFRILLEMVQVVLQIFPGDPERHRSVPIRGVQGLRLIVVKYAGAAVIVAEPHYNPGQRRHPLGWLIAGAQIIILIQKSDASGGGSDDEKNSD